MKTEKLQKWAKDLSLDDYVDLVLFYSRLCTVCSELNKK